MSRRLLFAPLLLALACKGDSVEVVDSELPPSDSAAPADRARFVIVAPDSAYPLSNQWLIGSGTGGTPQVDDRGDDDGFHRGLSAQQFG